MCTLLAQVVQNPPQPNSLRERLQRKSEELGERYSREGYRCSGEVATSFRILRILVEFFDYYHTKQFTLALKVIIDSRLVPLQLSDLQECVNSFKKYNTDVWSVFPDLLLATMNILFDQYQKIKGKEFVPQRYQDTVVDKVGGKYCFWLLLYVIHVFFFCSKLNIWGIKLKLLLILLGRYRLGYQEIPAVNWYKWKFWCISFFKVFVSFFEIHIYQLFALL